MRRGFLLTEAPFGVVTRQAAHRLADAAGALPPRPQPPQDDPLAEALTRIARQMEIAAGALVRLG